MMKEFFRHWIKWLLDFVVPQVTNTVLGGDGHREDKRYIARGVKKFVDSHYELRYNVLKQTEEFRPKDPAGKKCGKRLLFWKRKAKKPDENVSSLRPDESSLRPDESSVFPGESSVCPDESSSHEMGSGGQEKGSGGDGDDGWRQLTDRELRRIAFEQMEEVGVAWSVDVELYVRSSLLRSYNPALDYLSGCGVWDGQTDHIGALARRIPTDAGQWTEWFRRWFVAMVAQWQQHSRNHGNAIVPILIGDQGTHKSTFCRLLLPPELREYYIDDIKLDNAEQTERMVARMLLVNIDEYNAKTDREQAKIKRVLTERDVQTRRMRSDQYVMLPRMASFIATTNDRMPLTDPTGSRRYLCCELTGTIDTDTPLDHRQLYAQALAELRRGTPWYFTRAEEADIERHNMRYRQETLPELALTTWFEPAARSKDHFMTAVQIQQELQHHMRAADVPSLNKLCGALRACGFSYGAVNGRRGWYARMLA